MTSSTATAPRAAVSLRSLDRPLAGLGFAWSAFGVYQFFATTFATSEGLMAMGRSAEQAALYKSLPVWMTAVFAIGVGAGLAGSALLFLRRAEAKPLLAASLLGYAALFAGDVAYGVFAAFGAGQVVVLAFTVALAGLLLVRASARPVARPS